MHIAEDKIIYLLWITLLHETLLCKLSLLVLHDNYYGSYNQRVPTVSTIIIMALQCIILIAEDKMIYLLCITLLHETLCKLSLLVPSDNYYGSYNQRIPTVSTMRIIIIMALQCLLRTK